MPSESERHFVQSEADVVDAFLLPGWRAEIDAGKAQVARDEMTQYLDQWCHAGMEVRTENGERRFDPVVLNFACQRGLDGRDDFWMKRAVAPRRAAAEKYLARASSSRFHDPRRIEILLRREFHFPNRAPGSKVLVSFAVPVDEPTQQNVVVTPQAVVDGEATVQDGLLVARARLAEDRWMRVETRFDLVGYQHTVDVDASSVEAVDLQDPTLQRYLAPSEGIVRVTARIDELARSLARPDAYETILAIWDYLFDERRVGSLYHHALDPSDPLGSSGQWLDCYIGSALFVALARAARVPARMVHGALLSPLTDMGHHYWIEAYVPPYGWIPFDLRGWVLAAGNRRDPTWGRFLAGHLPYQLVYQRLPAAQMVLGGRYPARWYSMARLEGRGQWSEVYDLDTGALMLRDYYEVAIS